ncbi:MAG: creatinine amidohydrolase [Deltaproteobacteria bacterium GWA2_54_12]|nr:MAG: creatinine amidohydrolase [Deltaproteobacteria bacterium GWA2_54_12]
MLVGEITMSEFKKAVKKSSVLIVPFGTVEAHGTHLPLNTDTLVIREAVRKVAERNMSVFMAPPIQYGVCTSTGPHPGTIGITASSLRLLASDIVKSGYAQGFRNIILVSGHGGSIHVSALKEVAEELVARIEGLKMAAFSIYEVIGREAAEIAETKGDSHAGELETSLVLHLAPRLVKGRSKEEYPDFPRPLVVKDKLKYWPGAVWGDPGKATAEKGERLFNAMVDKLEEVAGRLERSR